MLKNISDSRDQQLKELKNFTDAVNEEIAGIAGILGWTVESVTNVNEEYFTCPYDPSHRLTEASLNDHLVSCQWNAEGYGKQDIPLSESTLSTDSPFCIKFDKQLQEQVLRQAKEQNPMMQIGMGERLIPHTSDRIVIDFTSDERRALYDYVIANTAKPDIGENIANMNNLELQQKEDKELSFLELLIQERNLKRRRIKHRGVHTNKKSHTEILREVINQQMEIYVDYISGQNNSECVTDIQNIKTDESYEREVSYEKMQDRTERLYKVFHTSSRNYDYYNSEEKNDHHHKKKRDNKKRDHSEERNYHRSKDRDKRKKYSDETDRKHRHKYRKSSHSRERKSHKKDKHRSKNRHKDKYYEKKHKSQDRDKSSERHYSKHSDYKQKDKDY